MPVSVPGSHIVRLVNRQAALTGAADGNRTRVTSLEGWCFAIELLRHIAGLSRLSGVWYSAGSTYPIPCGCCARTQKGSLPCACFTAGGAGEIRTPVRFRAEQFSGLPRYDRFGTAP